MASELIQIYYREEQKTSCFPFARLYNNEKLTIFFENTPLRELVMASESEKIAVCSWKLKEKLRYYIGRPCPLTQEVLETDYHVLSFTRNTDKHQMLAAADRWHKGFRETMKKILDAIDIKMPHEVKVPIYQNHHSTRRDIYQDYIKTYLSPAMEVMTSDPAINKLIMADSKYSQLAKNHAATSDYLKEKIGVGFYPLAPFLLERLFSIYVHNHRIPVTYL